MTPREKASQLIVAFQLKCKSLEYEEAMQCALIAVDEVANILCDLPYGLDYINRRDYWEQVKKELEEMMEPRPNEALTKAAKTYKEKVNEEMEKDELFYWEEYYKNKEELK